MESESKNETPKVEKRDRMISQVQFLLGKLKRTSSTYDEGAFWEALENSVKDVIARPLE